MRKWQSICAWAVCFISHTHTYIYIIGMILFAYKSKWMEDCIGVFCWMALGLEKEWCYSANA